MTALLKNPFRYSVDEVIDLAGSLEALLLSVGHGCYDRDQEILINTAAAIKYSAIQTFGIDLPTHISREAARIADRIRSNWECAGRAAEWALQQGWPDLEPECSIASFGKADIFARAQGLIIEVGDCRVDKPMTAARLGYSTLVVPQYPTNLAGANVSFDAVMFIPGPNRDGLDVLI